MSNLRQAAQQALEALERINAIHYLQDLYEALDWEIDALRAALAEPEQETKADAHLFYAPGDVLICKESGEKATVVNGNTGPLQLASGKITLQWTDEVHGEYTLEQIMDGFIRQTEPEQEPQTTHWEGCEAVHPECRERVMDRDTIIRLAREAAFYTPVMEGELMRFAALVAAHEREECAQIAKQWDSNHPNTNYGGCIANLIRSRT